MILGWPTIFSNNLLATNTFWIIHVSKHIYQTNQGTDHTYCKEYELFKNTPEGVFVDKLSGAPLFDTKHRFNSKTGWLSFTEAIEDSVTEHMDYSYGMVRVEIRSKSSGIHLGHVFNDGPNGKPRYCINATVLEFVPNLDT